MADESDLSRTEPASPRRLQEARSAGDVPRSAELAAWLVLLSALAALGWLAPRLLNAMQALTEAAFVHAAQPFSPVLLEAAQSALWAVLPVLVVIFAAALLAPMLLSGWVYAPQVTQADLTRANPFKPLLRLFSADAWFDGALALLKLALVVGAVGWAWTRGWPELQGLTGGDVDASLSTATAWVARGVLILTAALTLGAAVDAGWRWWRYLRRHAMTWQEVLAEAREAEVHPEVRAQVRGRQQQAARGPLLNPQAGEGANARPTSSPLPNPLPQAGEGANARPTSINEVIG